MRKFFPGDVVSYVTLHNGALNQATVVHCPSDFRSKPWAVKYDTVWVIRDGDTQAGWIDETDLTMVARRPEPTPSPLTNSSICDTMGISTDNTETSNMTFTAAHAEPLLDMLGDYNIRELSDEQMEAIVALRAVNRLVDIYMIVQPGQHVAGIKTIRSVTGLGLKEAKDLYDSLDPSKACGRVGPIVARLKRADAAARMAVGDLECALTMV